MQTSKLRTVPLYRITRSSIHNTGVVAAADISKGTRILEYRGERISKEEGDRRSEMHIEMHARDPNFGEVYVFEIDDRYDIDGSVPYNDARFINHSCSPNCESDIIDGKIWIVATRDIKEGEELAYDYSYDLDEFEEYPCRCGSENCFGFILDADLWENGRKILAEKNRNNNMRGVGFEPT